MYIVDRQKPSSRRFDTVCQIYIKSSLVSKLSVV